MTTEDMIEKLIELSYTAYKKNSRGCVESRRLDRKQPVEIDGYTFSCWREYICYKVCEYIKLKIPEAVVDLELDGNDSVISLSMSDEEGQILNSKMYTLIKEWSNL